jgi:hypothetical protein
MMKEFKVRGISWHSTDVSRTANGAPKNRKELSRLLTAAVINREFCNLLLANPALAVATGYNGQSFQLATEEEELILSIHATSLADFAAQLTIHGNGNGHSRLYNGKGHNHNGHNGTNGTFNGKLNGHRE